MAIQAAFIFCFFSLISSFPSPSYGYDPLDPNGNMTITWDFILQNGNLYDITVSIRNNQLFRHVEMPGWKVGWEWKGEKVIWNMWGAEATEQGNCSRFRGSGELPHCCERQPRIVDLMLGAPCNKQVSNCCKGGVLGSLVQDPTNYVSSFRMIAGADTNNVTDIQMPKKFTLGLPGYTCGNPFEVAPTRFSQDGGRRYTQALATWNVNCIYSQFRASSAPKCCVSLSAFYNETIVSCPKSSCNCQGLPGSSCVKPGKTPPLLELPHTGEREEEQVSPFVRCSKHMCPIRVHWHIKQNYRQYWRVRMTLTNLNYINNYSHWNLVALHPNFRNVIQVFSFNYRPLNQNGNFNDTGMFWGIQNYNEMYKQRCYCTRIQEPSLSNKDGLFPERSPSTATSVSWHLRTSTRGSPAGLIFPLHRRLYY
ncbi:hypothetical protein L484_006961 [Morus notabilis]|uniref:COBRA-like protein n=1 Tax=Morus notabilis TaxID=981085 RepID=W9RIK2_9ROSA|nr:hypothetical protein L484_006961 [Morus notabilis]